MGSVKFTVTPGTCTAGAVGGAGEYGGGASLVVSLKGLFLVLIGKSIGLRIAGVVGCWGWSLSVGFEGLVPLRERRLSAFIILAGSCCVLVRDTLGEMSVKMLILKVCYGTSALVAGGNQVVTDCVWN